MAHAVERVAEWAKGKSMFFLVCRDTESVAILSGATKRRDISVLKKRNPDYNHAWPIFLLKVWSKVATRPSLRAGSRSDAADEGHSSADRKQWLSEEPTS